MFIIFLVIAMFLQVSISGLIALGPQGVVPDFLVLAGILIAFRAGSDDDIPLQCWMLGLVHDLSSMVPFGVYSTALALVALVIVSLRKWLNVRSIFIAIILTFAFSAAIEYFAIIITLFKNNQNAFSLAEHWPSVLFSAAYTAALSPYLQVFIKRPAWNLQNYYHYGTN